MPFNINDFKQGEIGKARFDEIINEIIRVIDPKVADIDDVKRIVSSFLASSEKRYKYKKAEVNGNEPSDDIGQDLKLLNEIKFFMDVQAYNQMVLTEENFKAIEREKQEKEAFDRAIRDYNEENLEKIKQNTSTEIAQQKQQELMNMILAEQQRITDRLNELSKQKSNLQKANKALNNMIKASRVITAQKISNHLNDIEVNGKKIFEGVDEKTKNDFSMKYLELAEIAARNNAEIDMENDDLKQQIVEKQKKLDDLTTQTIKGSTLTSFNRQTVTRPDGQLRKLRSEISELNQRVSNNEQRKVNNLNVSEQKQKELIEMYDLPKMTGATTEEILHGVKSNSAIQEAERQHVEVTADCQKNIVLNKREEQRIDLESQQISITEQEYLNMALRENLNFKTSTQQDEEQLAVDPIISKQNSTDNQVLDEDLEDVVELDIDDIELDSLDLDDVDFDDIPDFDDLQIDDVEFQMEDNDIEIKSTNAENENTSTLRASNPK